jgi:hypothetical protein
MKLSAIYTETKTFKIHYSVKYIKTAKQDDGVYFPLCYTEEH